MSWPKKKISELAEVQTGGTPSTRKNEYWNGHIPWINSGALNDGFILKASKYITELGLKNSSAKMLPKETVVIALTGATTGQVGILQIEASANQSVTGILPSESHYPKYLYYFLKTIRKKIKSDTFGGAQPHINQQYVKDIKIPIPENYDDQIRIATLLSRAESLIAKRKESIRLLNELIKSTFLEMFGDPYFNVKKWPLKKLRDLCELITKGTTPKSKEIYEKYEEGYIPFLKVYHIMDDGSINFEYEPSFVDYQLHNGFLSRSKVYPNDVLMNIVGPPLGKLGIVPNKYPEWNVNQAIAIYRCRELLMPRFLLYTLKSNNFLYSIVRMAVGIRQQNLSLEQCRNVEIPLPPISLQDKFTGIVEKVESIKAQYEASLTELENLYGSLSQRAFCGELDLSRVTIDTVDKPEPVEAKLESHAPEVETTKKFTKKELIKILKQESGQPCSFNELWNRLEKSSFKDLPEYDEVKKMIFDMLEGENPILSQSFDKEKKEIALRINV